MKSLAARILTLLLPILSFAPELARAEPAALFFHPTTPLTIFNGFEGLLVGTNGFRITGDLTESQLGSAVCGAGDVNADGAPDILIAAPQRDIGPNFRAGRAYLLYGGFVAAPDQSVNFLPAVVIDGAAADDRAGTALAGGRDWNGDGNSDFAVGAPLANVGAVADAGTIGLVYGATNLPTSLPLAALNGTNGFRMTGAHTNGEAGASLALLRDFNGDGRADLAIGAPGATGTGRVYLVYGATSAPPALALESLNGTNGFIIEGESAFSQTGAAVADIGDWNGDGRSDLAVGAPGFGGFFAPGRVYVVFGRTNAPARLALSSLNGTNGFALDGFGFFSGLGTALAGADLNGDGRADLVAGARGLDRVFVIPGVATAAPVYNAAALNGTNGYILVSTNAGGFFGASVARGGRLNADDFDDLLIGAPNEPLTGLAGAGRVYAVMGRAAFGATNFAHQLDGTNGFVLAGQQSGAELGHAVANAGNWFGDGFDTPLLGARLHTAGPPFVTNAGAVYLVGPPGIAEFALTRPVVLSLTTTQVQWTAQSGARYTVRAAESPLATWTPLGVTTQDTWAITASATTAVFRIDATRAP